MPHVFVCVVCCFVVCLADELYPKLDNMVASLYALLGTSTLDSIVPSVRQLVVSTNSRGVAGGGAGSHMAGASVETSPALSAISDITAGSSVSRSQRRPQQQPQPSSLGPAALSGPGAARFNADQLPGKSPYRASGVGRVTYEDSVDAEDEKQLASYAPTAAAATISVATIGSSARKPTTSGRAMRRDSDSELDAAIDRTLQDRARAGAHMHAQ